MMKKYLLPILALFAVSCADKFTPSSDIEDIKSDLITPTEALSSLSDFVNGFNSVTTKSSDRFELDLVSIEAFGSKQLNKTKSSAFDLPDTLCYIANMTDGFAVLSANRQLEHDVYCVTEKGELHTEDFVHAMQLLNKADEIKGEDVVPAILLSAIVNEYNRIETKSNSAGEDPGSDMNEDGSYRTEEDLPNATLYGPFLKTKWANSYFAPFNTYTPNHTCPGCVAIAVAQIMVCNRVSNTMTFNGVTCDWDDMESVYKYDGSYFTYSAKDQVANFVYEIGKEDNVHVRYDSGSWAMADGAKRTFSNYGYSNVTKRVGFASGDRTAVRNQLTAHKPVYMGGCLPNTTTEGHAWVIDGLYGDYYHINWGWLGDCDGYFRIGTFITSSRSAIDSEIDDYYNSSSADYSFTWTYRIVLYNL